MDPTDATPKTEDGTSAASRLGKSNIRLTPVS
jgi:hypothetical protein